MQGMFNLFVQEFHKLKANPGASHLAARYSQAYAASPGNTRWVLIILMVLELRHQLRCVFVCS